jgi:hypothetical protein
MSSSCHAPSVPASWRWVDQRVVAFGEAEDDVEMPDRIAVEPMHHCPLELLRGRYREPATSVG